MPTPGVSLDAERVVSGCFFKPPALQAALGGGHLGWHSRLFLHSDRGNGDLFSVQLELLLI